MIDLPPGFDPHPDAPDPWRAAHAGAHDGPAGSLWWHAREGWLGAAILFVPDRPLQGGRLLLELGLLAAHDALAALAPPQLPIHLAPPDLMVNAGRVGSLRVAQAGANPEVAPDWAILGLDLALDRRVGDPGITAELTSLAEEGMGEVAAAEILAQFCRHLLLWLDTWRDRSPDQAMAGAVAARVARVPA